MVLATALLVHGRSGLDSEKHGQKAVLALKWTLLSQKFCGNLLLEKGRADSCARGFSGRERKRLFIARSLLD